MKNVLVAASLLAPLAANGATLEERVEELEFARDLNVIQWSGELNTRADSVTKKTETASGSNEVSFNLYRMKFSLNMDATLSNRLAFHGRITQGKVFNELLGQSGVADGSTLNSLNDLHGYSGNQLYVEKAYFDFNITDNLIFTVGRLPTAEGGPYHLTIGKPNRSTYPRLAYAYSLDGVALSYNLGDLSFKALYHPFSTSDRDGNYFKERTLASGLTPKPSDAHLWVGMVDYSKMGTFLAKKIEANLHYVSLESLYLLTQPNTPTTENGITSTTYSDLYLHSKRASAYLELNGFLKTPLTLAIAHSAGVSKGFISKTNGVATDANGNVVATIDLERTNPKTQYAAGTLITAKYDIKVGAKQHSVGAQYMMNNRFFSLTDLAGREPFNLWSVAGNAMHVFYNYPLDNGLVWNTGYIAKDPKYNTTSGADLSTDQGDTITKSSSAYMELILGF